ncbi:OprD family outer membrane porin [Sulfurimonas sp. SAG-AH-194-I05]|nr:OprD family outer membrane porin [Sulfurimonas sp. SAG-AH-194-I05]MDF1874527.1 OprD family outer membrane porin [Sulfurimonas sp. SAG-AH-194-I05]
MKTIFLGLLSIMVLQAGTIQEAFEEATVDGEIRSVYYSRDAKNSIIFGEAGATAVGGNLGITTKAVNNITFSTRFYTTNALTGSGTELSNTDLVDETSNYSILGQINLEYNDGINMFKIGRQTLQTPLVYSDDARVVIDTFEAASFSTKIITDTTLKALYIHRSSGFDNGAAKKDFVSMSKTLGTSYDEGMAVYAIENDSLADIALQVWYYDAFKLVDMFYYDVSYKKSFSKDTSLQLQGHYWTIKSKSAYEVDTGKKIDYNYGGVRASFINKSLTLQLAQERINYADQTVGIHTSWGMYTEYTYGILMGSGIYGALNGIGGNYITKVDATKLTFKYDFGNDINTYIGYNIYDADGDAWMSDMNLLDVYVSFPCRFIKNATWALLYENWDSDGDKIMVDNNLLKLKFSYKF